MCSFPRLNGSLLGSLLRARGSAEEAVIKKQKVVQRQPLCYLSWYVPKPGDSFGTAAVCLGFVGLSCGLNSGCTVALGLSHGVDNASLHSVLLR